ncbi:NADH-quinone oxidoreductase subunit G [Sulfurimonas diazotrophicus]|uniref:NADH-quinone oxidoreductase subunit G n=1 Tax=Sulfurimonas diazotrophicus TaxID=3131939 RepID=A0ABZ3HCW9_9BACT
MSKITITIDGRPIECEEGEYILNAARANGIFIPAICYLTRCSPTLACRICLVEADGKQVYACNAKTKEGMDITTTTDNIETERRSIMEVYDVNHPLQCGVCDQSGECELQNYTLEMGVDSQSYTIADVERPIKDWGHLHYDPGLCIVCERCVTVCKDMIGDNSLKTVPRGGEGIDAAFKESMPKDAYSMWNKLNKSIIGLTSGEEMLDCTSCGECAAVCPVGALVDTDFVYTTNAWEQQKVPATCSHCSAGCQLNYEVKHTSVASNEEKIYRTSNEWNYVSLCGAGRYGYDFENRDVEKDETAFNAALSAFEKADTIRFTSTISNEEALMLQKLKERKGYRLINEEARTFKTFLDDYAEVSGQQLYGGDLKLAHDANFVVSVGTALKSDNPNARYAFNNAIKMNKGAGIYFHPLADPVIEGIGKGVFPAYHKPLREEAALYLILDLFGDKEKMPADVAEYLASFHTLKTMTVEETIKEKVVEKVMVKKVNEETGEEEEVEEEKTTMVPKKVSKEVEVDENRLLELLDIDADEWTAFLDKNLKKKDAFALIAGPDLYTHPNAKNLARLLALVEKFTDFSLTMIPPLSNTLGVALICDLDAEAGDYSIGYNTAGDFVLSALGDGDLDMPAMNQQEGTLTGIEKRVNPTNAALPYGGYVLNDIANALGLNARYTIDYTAQLPVEAGFEAREFDSLPNRFDNDGTEVRGYALKNVAVAAGEASALKIDEALTLEGENVIYAANPVRQFTAFTMKPHQLNEQSGIYLSPAQLEATGLAAGDAVLVTTASGEQNLTVVEDNKIDGSVMCVTTFDPNIKTEELFGAYRFATASIHKEG